MDANFTIVKQNDRYPGIDPHMPDRFTVIGLNLEQARYLAEQLSNHNAGCDYCWLVEGDE